MKFWVLPSEGNDVDADRARVGAHRHHRHPGRVSPTVP
jgi:hypothetical protein